MDMMSLMRRKKEDTSIHTPQREKISKTLQIKELNWTPKQKEFIELAMDSKVKVLLVGGDAGTGKTLLATYILLKLLSEKKISDIVYVRSAVESSEAKLGFLPGTVEEKLLYYNLPFFDKLEELLNKNDAHSLVKDERVTGYPINFARGMTFNVKGVIFDEAQNSSFKEIVTLLTRTGRYSKVFVCADEEQSDLSQNKQGGFRQVLDVFDNAESRGQGIYTFTFGEEDVMRSELVKFIVKKIKLLKKENS